MNHNSIHLKPGQTTFQFSFGSHFPTYTLSNPELILAPGIYPVACNDQDNTAAINWKPYITLEEHVPQFWQWIQSRGGVAFWQSQDLSSGGKTVQTPVRSEDGTPKTKPHWQYPDSPLRIITDPKEILVVVAQPDKDLPLKRNGEETIAVRERFKQLPPHSYYLPDFGGSKPVAKMYVATAVVPLDEYIERSRLLVMFLDYTEAPRAQGWGSWDLSEEVSARAKQELEQYIAARAAVGETLRPEQFKKVSRGVFVPRVGEENRYTPRK